MLYKPKVFISHSAKEPETRQLCETLADRLAQEGFEVLWDATLQTSEAWRAVIDEWIWRCDTAVLVLSDAATHSRCRIRGGPVATALAVWVYARSGMVPRSERGGAGRTHGRPADR